jgi:hypothetical protein
MNIIKVEVGDNMQVIFMNKASRPYSFNPFGLAFTKDNEGALYKNKRYSKLEFAVSDFINYKPVYCPPLRLLLAVLQFPNALPHSYAF